MVQNQNLQNTIEGQTNVAKSIDQIRKDGIDAKTMEKITADRMILERAKEEAKTRLPGNFLSLKNDREQRCFLFTGNYQVLDLPAKDFVTKQVIPGKMVKRWRWQVYDVTNDDNSEPQAGIWERGFKESSEILYWLSQSKNELNIMRQGQPNSQSTSYTIWPATK